MRSKDAYLEATGLIGRHGRQLAWQRALILAAEKAGDATAQQRWLSVLDAVEELTQPAPPPGQTAH